MIKSHKKPLDAIYYYTGKAILLSVLTLAMSLVLALTCSFIYELL